jgi:PleD family two-component response regulator
MKILVVEDQKVLGMALSRTLNQLGHESRLVPGGAAAWDIIDREDWRLILTDWMMPDVDGLELCRRIRGQRGSPYRYVIILTGRSERSDRLQGLEAGADDFLTKPVDEDELIIRLAIARRILAVQWELEASIARLDAMASTDPLTGLSNRRHLPHGKRDRLTQGCLAPASGRSSSSSRSHQPARPRTDRGRRFRRGGRGGHPDWRARPLPR